MQLQAKRIERFIEQTLSAKEQKLQVRERAAAPVGIVMDHGSCKHALSGMMVQAEPVSQVRLILADSPVLGSHMSPKDSCLTNQGGTVKK